MRLRFALALACLALMASCSKLPESPTGLTIDPVAQPKAELSAAEGVAPSQAIEAAALQNNVPVTGLSGAKTATQLFTIDVPAGQSQLEIKITGSTGDCDLYVKFGSPPTTSSWDYRPYTPYSNETVTVANPAAGTWYIMLRGFSGYSAVTLVASYTAAPVGKPDLTMYAATANPFIETRFFSPENCAVLDGSVVAGTRRLLRFSAESRNQGTADLVLGDPAAHPELFTYDQCHGHYHYHGFIAYKLLNGSTLVAGGQKVAFCLEDFSKFDSSAGPAKYSCAYQGISVGWSDIYSGTLDGQWIDITDVAPGTYTLQMIVDPDNDFAEINENNNTGSLTVTVPPATPDNATVLQSGVPVTGLGGAAGSLAYFKITVPPGATLLNVSTSGGTGDMDLYVKQGSQPSTTVFDFRSWGTSNSENVGASFPAAADWYVTLHGYKVYSGVTLTATVSLSGPAPAILQPGVPATNLSGAQGTLVYYKITVTSGSPVLNITTSGGSGDVDLYVKYGAQPSTSSFDARSWSTSTAENVQIAAPRTGDWYITLHGYGSYSGVTLSGSLNNTEASANQVVILGTPTSLVKEKRSPLGQPIPIAGH